MYIERLVLGPLQTNCYLVAEHKNSNHLLLIDPADDPNHIIHQVCGRKIEAVLLTHGHFDHTGALHAFEGLPIYMHKADARFLSDAHYGTGGFAQMEYTARPPATHLLCGGEELLFEGLETPLHVLHTPGHTPGSCVYRMGSDYFTGDTLFKNGYGRCDLPGGNMGDLIRSLGNLVHRLLDGDVYPGHGPFTTLRKERRYP